jgi:hypothetical protein
MAQSLEERYEAAAEKVRSSDGEPSAADKNNYHKLRDQLRARAAEERAAQPGGAVTADRVEVS